MGYSPQGHKESDMTEPNILTFSPFNYFELLESSESESEVAQSYLTFCQAPLSMGFSRQECWSGLPFPSPGDHPDPGIETRSPALQADALPSEPPGKSHGFWKSKTNLH